MGRRSSARTRASFAEVERLHEIIIRAEIKESDAIIHARTRRDDEDRRVVFPRAQFAQQLAAFLLRQVDVEQHEIEGS